MTICFGAGDGAPIMVAPDTVLTGQPVLAFTPV
jgi:hypothetical protein